MKAFRATSLAVGLALCSGAAQADVFKFKLGGDLWRADSDIRFADAGTPAQPFETQQKSQGSFWVALEHPLPIIPNVMIRENSLETKGNAPDSDFQFGGMPIDGNYNADANLSNTDFIFYYQFLDTKTIELDLGAAYKRFHGNLAVGPAVEGPTLRVSRDLSHGQLFAYARTQIKVPGIGLYGFVDVMTDGSQRRYDYSGGLGWIFRGTGVDYKLRVGYRDMKFDHSSASALNTYADFKGGFAGIELEF
ncbi:TIGR04219 family outer membrane beta-barrel protein [Paraferrimonas sedimenticola]|uniref:Outer membrane protein n=1 Tax=Paraferrimonas sedimenticola TaxID=375674 RepID=A0AA37RXK4_9GAMM|nr:TIGR04219 family outer membrane beta-barrel protein [Paraferrimonas sedimenticola]GLP97233.1 outer membrane protein [Paraferrimonas sedimenticola]